MPALISHKHADNILAYDQGQAISARQYLASVRHMASVLPRHGHVLNLCTNRYHFAVVMGAALLRRHPMLLPSTRTPAMLLQLRQQYSGVYAVVEQASELAELPCISFSDCEPEFSAATSPFEVPEIESDQIAAYVFTSGSTGLPIAHAKRWGTLVHNAQAEGARVRQHMAAPANETGTFSVTGTVPAQHMYGFESTVLLPLQNHGALDASHPFYPADIAEALRRAPGPRLLVTTPFHLRTLIESKAKTPALELVLSATAALSPQLASQAEKLLGAPLFEIYGCTEAGQVATRRTTSTPVWETYAGVEIQQQNYQHSEPLFFAQGGHIDGRIPLGDVLELHSSSTFNLLGRQADMVNIAGKRTSLAYLNHELNSIQGVIDGAFYLLDNEALDARARVQRPVAFVVAPGMSESMLTRALRQRIDPVFMPRPICFLDQLPRNETGKLPQQALADLLHAIRTGVNG